MKTLDLLTISILWMTGQEERDCEAYDLSCTRRRKINVNFT